MLDRPLRAAIVGDVNVGKSTLVNALLRHRIVVTHHAENTAWNWWFQAAGPDGPRIRVIRRDRPGEDTYKITDSAEVAALPAASVEKVIAELDEPVLADLTIIDTPGLHSQVQENSGRTADLLGVHPRGEQETLAGVGKADVLIYVSDQLPGSSDAERIAGGFRRLGVGSIKTPVDILLVFAQVDKLGFKSQNPLARAAEIAAAHRPEWESVAWNVKPVIAQLAQTARCGVLDASLLGALRKLAALPKGREAACRSVDMLVRRLNTQVDESGAKDLWQNLLPYGLSLGFALADRGELTAENLAAALEKASGIAALESVINDIFRRRQGLLRSAIAMRRLSHAAFADGDTRTLSRIEDMYASAYGRELRDLNDLRTASDQNTPLRPGQREELRVLFSGDYAGTPGEAAKAAVRWLRPANVPGTPPVLRTLALHAAAAYGRLAESKESR
ncbi:GTPase [Acrocarpospora pleiomorpha]|uniref:GTPase n=1 Tax=Acrocarpospora pleiomorpha TaxID=90975 RepID=A0A5M3XHP2_9ACTN|nr:GTPase [Acrocarpospora pleiomorpha]GES19181.1 GTPase [Acrocarpospora pleiomorpha]